MRAWKSGQSAPIIRTTEFIQYPYGLTEAIVTCEPLRVATSSSTPVRRSRTSPSGLEPMADAPGLQWRAGDPHSARHGQADRVRHRDQRHHHDDPGRTTSASSPRPRGTRGSWTREVLLPARPRRADERDVPREGSARAPGPDPTVARARGSRRTDSRSATRSSVGRAGVAACAGLRRWAARLHPDADRAPGERGAALLVQSRGESALVNYRVRLPYYVWTGSSTPRS